MKRLEAQVGARRDRAVHRGRLRRQPAPGQGLHRARRARAPTSRRASATWSTRGSSTAPRGSPAPTSPASHVLVPRRRPRLHRRRHDRGRRGASTATPCPVCGSPLEIARGIEIGHIFQLGRKYAEALGLTVLDQNGKQQVVTMGSYGIGVSRAVAAIAEMNCDDKGLIWPREVAPADVHIVATGKAGDPQLPAAEQLAAELRGRRAAGAARRSRRRVARRQVQRCRTDRRADDRRRRARPRRRSRRGQGPTHRRPPRRAARRRRRRALATLPDV